MNINRQTIRLYWQQARKYKTSFIIMLVAIPLGSLLIGTGLPFFFSQVVGMIARDDTSGATAQLIYAVIAGTSGAAMNFIGFQAMVRHESNIITALRNATFKSLLDKDMRFYVNEKIGSMTSKYIDFVRSETGLQDLFVIRTLGLTLVVVSGVTLIATKSLVVAGLLIFLIAALVAEVRWSLKKREYWRKKRKELRSEIHGHVADALANQLVVKTFTGERREFNTMQRLGKKFSYIYLKDFSFVSAEGSSRVLIMTVAQLIGISICLQLAAQGKIDVGTIVFVVTYLQFVASNIFSIGELINGYEEHLLEAAPMTEMLLKENTVHDESVATSFKKFTPTITFDNVGYRYEDGANHVLRDINLTIPAGQKVGLVGHSGAGKTTITHLLLRFSDVTDGSLLVSGKDVRSITQLSLREHIAFVPQEPMLFHRSLRENIAYGAPEVDDKEIVAAAKKAHAWEFIEKLPHGLDTTVGERGVKLSGGQRQRIAIARAILKDAPILVLDEATSALDSESEKLIQAALAKLMQSRTSIVIAHRLSTIAKLDRIIVLDQGSIVEDGTHAELLEQKGIYASLWSHQSGGFIEE